MVNVGSAFAPTRPARGLRADLGLMGIAWLELGGVDGTCWLMAGILRLMFGWTLKT